MTLTITLLGPPRTKKNSQRIIRAGSFTRIVPSKAFAAYEKDCLRQIHSPPQPVAEPVNVRCLYYMPTRRRVDLVNLLEATCDILVKAGVLADDNSRIIVGHDGSRVLYDKERPRVEVTISEGEGERQC